jgi:type III restriction enzyme
MYNHQGVINRYFPDFIIRLNNDNHLILETKGQDTNRDKTKRSFLDEWCKAVNQHGGFGKWEWGVSFNPNDLDEIIQNK